MEIAFHLPIYIWILVSPSFLPPSEFSSSFFFSTCMWVVISLLCCFFNGNLPLLLFRLHPFSRIPSRFILNLVLFGVYVCLCDDGAHFFLRFQRISTQRIFIVLSAFGFQCSCIIFIKDHQKTRKKISPNNVNQINYSIILFGSFFFYFFVVFFRFAIATSQWRDSESKRTIFLLAYIQRVWFSPRSLNLD